MVAGGTSSHGDGTNCFLFSFLDAKTFATSTISTLSVSVLWVLGIAR